jgi:hypothetical protein
VLSGRKDNRYLEERTAYQAEILTLQEKIHEAEGKRVRSGDDVNANLLCKYYNRTAAEIFLVSITMTSTQRVEICWNFNSEFT